MRKLLVLLTLVLLTTNVSAWQPVEDTSKWSCYDYSFDYKQNNPEWGICVIGYNQYFRGTTHAVNYLYTEDNKTILIHDAMLGLDYEVTDYKNDRDGRMFHFFENNGVRNYKFLYPNSPFNL